MLSRIRQHVDGEHKLQVYFFPNIFKAAFQRVCERFLRGFQIVPMFPSVSKGFQRVSKRFERVSKRFKRVSKRFKRVSKGFQKCFQRVSKAFPKGFKPSETGFQKGFRVTSNPLKNAFVDKTCFRMEGHISFDISFKVKSR